ncbi:DUF4890 domain-containing protein [Alistipes sp. dk3620]|uniref:DUF4890 domain-containing protein n=1 Tax=unclassified Alistipes TaxID=2608932 RepID=UPI0006C07E04|nr:MULTISPECIES: DUF4890 domain-containing protein [unclassified Alistipes]MQX26890.1 DUF4890 domain-containing protein [Alistipes sp. dk3620]QGA24279.1 DUF4890 domain-containing protein [Alistipes sp. dk3624]VDR33857.1 P pilus assembly/Cpx signaling pathway, periplasmic inhibitor/zinc-resistance associated protein [Faecalibacterium prausnitzii]HIV59905.1 DUF4890 domain-containing protein [Candidatus Alistipes pullistercoris]
MKAKHFFVSAFAMLFAAIGATAQPQHREQMTPEQRADRMTQRMTEQLSLSTDQAEQIRRIFLSNFEEMKADRAARADSAKMKSDRPKKGDRPKQGDKSDGRKGQGGPHAERMAKMDESIKKVLTEEQYEKWTEQRAKMQTRHRPRPEVQPQGE